MVAPARAADAELLVGHMWRYRDEVRALGRASRTASSARCAHPRLRRARRLGPSGWFTDPVLAGGGALIDDGHPRHRYRAVPARRPGGPVRVRASLGTSYGELTPSMTTGSF